MSSVLITFLGRLLGSFCMGGMNAVRSGRCKNILGPIYAFLKIENTNDAEKMLHFNFGLQYTETCSGCDENSEFAQRVLIPANSSVEGSCSKPNYLGRIVRNLNNPVAGWHFENVTINYLTVD